MNKRNYIIFIGVPLILLLGIYFGLSMAEGMPYRYDEYPPYGLPINLWERRQNIFLSGHEEA